MAMISEPYYETEGARFYLGDSLEILKEMSPGSVDVIFADPPYFLSNGGITCSGGQQVSVNKGKWDEGSSLAAKHSFNLEWIRLCHTLLKPGGTIWVSGTMHNIYSVGFALE